MKQRDTRRTGNYYETKACRYLEEQGIKILERNYRFHREEIDIIARDGDDLIFVEVKARRNPKNGYGYQAVNAEKQRIIRRVALGYLQARHLKESSTPCRFDIISIDQNELLHFKNAF